MQQTLIVNVDGQNLNATHFGAMSAEEGPQRIIADGITTDETWAKRAHALCVEKVSPKAEVKAEAPVAEPAIAVEAEPAPAKAKK